MIRFLSHAFHSTTLLLLAAFTYRLWRNLRFLRHAKKLTRLPDLPPRVSVLIPARDEARTIVTCIESLASQDYPNFEVIALNDQSSDETGDLLDDLATRHSIITVLHGTENPPPNWNGKSYACHRLAEQATGEWLLFTDADTLHSSISLTQGMAQAEGLRVDLLSAFPRQFTGSWSERLIVSFILDFLPLIAVDLTTFRRGDSGSIVANGQYLLVRAAAYNAIGGHRAISDALVDDFALARHIRSNGYEIALVDGTSMLSCRMYRNARELWGGFAKNIMLALETSTIEKSGWRRGMLFAWGYAAVFVMPFYLLWFSKFKRLSLVEIGWLGFLRSVVNWYFDRPLIEVLPTPVAALSVMALGLSALLRRRQGKPIQWKGRNYSMIN